MEDAGVRFRQKNMHGFPSKVAIAAMGIIAAMGGVSCGGITIPPCLLDGTCLPSPPTPAPSASPSPTPTPVPSPSPSPKASPSPSPSVEPSPISTPAPSPAPSGTADLCPKPIRVKLALFAKSRLPRGTWRNVWNVTPVVPSTGQGGSCEWKRNQETGELPSECEAANSCSAVYARLFAPVDPAVGIPQAYQAGHNKDGSTFSHDPVERSSSSDYLLVITDAGQGPAKLCASFPDLPWRCQTFHVDAEGEAVGAEGNDRTRSYDEAK